MHLPWPFLSQRQKNPIWIRIQRLALFWQGKEELFGVFLFFVLVVFLVSSLYIQAQKSLMLCLESNNLFVLLLGQQMLCEVQVWEADEPDFEFRQVPLAVCSLEQVT